MTKIKFNTGLGCVMLIATMFMGWKELLLFTLFLFVFCEPDERLKGVATRVITFYLAFRLTSYAWNLIYDAIHIGFSYIDDIFKLISVYTRVPISANKFVAPFTTVLSMLDTAVSYLFTLAEFGFACAVLFNKSEVSTPVLGKINEFVNKILTYINNCNGVNTPAAQPVQNNVIQNNVVQNNVVQNNVAQ